MIRASFLLAGTAALLAACSPQAQPKAEASAMAMQSATHPVSGLEVIPLTVRSGDDTHRFRVEVAAYSLDSVVSAGVTSGVLELNGGRAEELGIEPGDLVEW